MRHVYVVLDLSASMNDTDLKPNRMQCVLHHMESFVDRFYDENPISQMAILATSNKRVEKVPGKNCRFLKVVVKGAVIASEGETDYHHDNIFPRQISDLSGNPLKHKEGLAKLKDRLPVGEPSLQNSINMAANVLQ